MEENMIENIWPQWKAVELLGTGSYGKVYKAKREEMGRQYFSAVKVIRIPSDESEVKDLERSGMDMPSIHSYYEEMIRNLLNEIQIMESLKSANNIVGIEDHQVVERTEGIGWDIYIRMELLTDLGTYLTSHKLSVNEIVNLGINICEALVSCEKVNIIHRDIKIDNVFVSEFGTFKLGDFGIAKQLEKTQSAFSQKGTNLYMAPEVFRNEHYNQTVDIYSLGIMLYRLLNGGRFPFMPPAPVPLQYSDAQSALEKRLSGEKLPDLTQVDGKLAQIVMRACEFAPQNRYQSAADMLQELKEYRRSMTEKNTEKNVEDEQDNMSSDEQNTVWEKDSATVSVFSQESSNEDNHFITEDDRAPEDDMPYGEEGKKNHGSRKKKIILSTAIVVFIAVAAFVAVFQFKSRKTNGEDGALSEEISTLKKLGISVRFPKDWEIHMTEDNMWAKKGDDSGLAINIGIRYPRKTTYDEDDQTNGMTQELAEHMSGNLLSGDDVLPKENALYDINGRNFLHLWFLYNGSEQSRFITYKDKTELEFCLSKDGTITSEEEKLYEEVMKSVILQFDGIDYSKLEPADANEDPFALSDTITNVAALGITVRLPEVCTTEFGENQMTATYPGSTYNDAYTLEFTRKAISESGYIDNGMNDSTVGKILEYEEKELGHSVRIDQLVSVNADMFLYMRSEDSEKKYVTLITMHNGVQYSYRMTYDFYVSYEGARTALTNIVSTVSYQ